MLKAVLDTNVVVSAHLTADGPAALIFRLALSRYFQCYVCEEILEEYCQVLQRRKFKLDADDVVQSLSAFRAAAVLLNPRRQVVAARDPDDDDKILEGAIEAKADYIVTGNIRDFRKQLRGVSVFPPRGFLNVLASRAG
jgi:putative PIN family toxin of toxin-antitoxin system